MSGTTVVEVVSPVNTDNANENNLSIGIKINYGETSYLICGDAEMQAELDMVSSGIDLKSDVYVVSHHGSSTSSGDVFLDAVSPSYAVISCGIGNSYGHPTKETLQRLQDRSILMYRTDKQGEVTAYSDGKNIWFNTYPCDDWSSGGLAEEVNPETSYSRSIPVNEEVEDVLFITDDTINTEPEPAYSYVCNVNTYKFHYDYCKSVMDMKEENKLYTDLSRDELIAEGYSPCGNCKP